MSRLQRGAIFKSVERTKVPFSTFDLSNENKFTCKMGRLTPFLVQELVPGDRFRWNCNMFVRLAPMVNPIMHRIDIRYSFFFVPYRILWNHWEKFRSEGNGDVLASERSDYQAPAHPYIDVKKWIEWNTGNLNSYFGAGTLADYLGFPSRQVVKGRLTTSLNHALKLGGRFPFSVAAYYCIYDNYYRNQLLEKSFAESLQAEAPDLVEEGYYMKDGDNTALFSYMMDDDWGLPDGIPNRPHTHASLCEANLEHDYFTSATASPQLGDPVQIPIGSTAEVNIPNLRVGTIPSEPNAQSIYGANSVQQEPIYAGLLTEDYSWTDRNGNHSMDAARLVTWQSGDTIDRDQQGHQLITQSGVGTADLSTATGITIQDFRALQALQRYRERLLAYGTRYTEWLRAVYAQTDGDARLDRPEYIGSYSQPIQISEVLQTSSTDSEPSPLGDYAGRGVSVGQCRDFNYMAPEDGVLLGIMQITPRTGYMCGLPHCFLRFSPYDYHLPAFEHVGKQEVYEQELYLQNSSQTADDAKGNVFGYNPRFSEYKYRFDEVHGDFITDPFLSWHLARDFSSQPTMSMDFFHASPVERIFAVTDSAYDKYYVQCFTKMIGNRPMTLYSTPL